MHEPKTKVESKGESEGEDETKLEMEIKLMVDTKHDDDAEIVFGDFDAPMLPSSTRIDITSPTPPPLVVKAVRLHVMRLPLDAYQHPTQPGTWMVTLELQQCDVGIFQGRKFCVRCCIVEHCDATLSLPDDLARRVHEHFTATETLVWPSARHPANASYAPDTFVSCTVQDIERATVRGFCCTVDGVASMTRPIRRGRPNTDWASFLKNTAGVLLDPADEAALAKNIRRAVREGPQRAAQAVAQPLTISALRALSTRDEHGHWSSIPVEMMVHDHGYLDRLLDKMAKAQAQAEEEAEAEVEAKAEERSDGDRNNNGDRGSDGDRDKDAPACLCTLRFIPTGDASKACWLWLPGDTGEVYTNASGPWTRVHGMFANWLGDPAAVHLPGEGLCIEGELVGFCYEEGMCALGIDEGPQQQLISNIYTFFTVMLPQELQELQELEEATVDTR